MWKVEWDYICKCEGIRKLKNKKIKYTELIKNMILAWCIIQGSSNTKKNDDDLKLHWKMMSLRSSVTHSRRKRRMKMKLARNQAKTSFKS